MNFSYQDEMEQNGTPRLQCLRVKGKPKILAGAEDSYKRMDECAGQYDSKKAALSRQQSAFSHSAVDIQR
ncbi:MAG TPA: hypothetical protein VG897_08830 [Terriglobales bacterium]|nr:hypothetical protein [Terriglobales bacterium]